MTNPPTPSQNPKTLDELCDKPTGTFKEFVKAQDSLTPLQKAVERLKDINECNHTLREDIHEVVHALEALQTENEEIESKWNKQTAELMAAVDQRNEIQKLCTMVTKELLDWKKICANRDLTVEQQGEEWVKLKTERDSYKSTYEQEEQKFAVAETLLESTRKEDAKMRDGKWIDKWGTCKVCGCEQHVAKRALSTTTDNSKDAK